MQEHKETIEECMTNLANLVSERCALDKIRGELYKMSAVPKFIQDCAVCEDKPDDTPGTSAGYQCVCDVANGQSGMPLARQEDY